MAEVAFEGLYRDEQTQEWGLDGWTSKGFFHILLTTEENGLVVDLDIKHCSKLAAALIEHIKEVKDASKENSG